jgi:hypothetical protein
VIGQVLKRLSSFVGDPSTGWSLEERIAQTLLDKMVQEQIPRDYHIPPRDAYPGLVGYRQ